MWGSGIKGGFVRLFYPTNIDEISNVNQPTWLPNKEYAMGMIKYAKLPSWLLGNVFYWLIGSIKLECYWNAPLLSTEKLPCIVFSHGLAGNRCVYSTFCLELASYGYVVAAVEHRDKSASATYYIKESGANKIQTTEWVPFYKLDENEDEFQIRNSQVHQRAKECMQTLNFLEQLNEGEVPRNLLGAQFDNLQWKDQLNVDNAAIIGHSFGAATTVAALAKDKRFKFGIALDAWMFPLGDELYHHTVNQPLLFVNTETFHWKQNIKQINKLLENNAVERIMITVKGTSHITQCDLPYVLPSTAMKLIGMNSQLDISTSMDIYKCAIATFVSKYFGNGKEFRDDTILMNENDNIIIGSNVQ